MMEAVGVSQGLVVVHLFCARTSATDDAAVLSAVKDATEAGTQVVTVAVLGHKAQLCFMGLHADAWALRDLQTGLVRAGVDIVDSYVSITELSEYALGLPAEMADMRLNPKLPPPDKPAWCFYPMTK
ncbi:MAG: chlorite dismutase, partial [Acidimicrobiaceae bacterium]|nr:chlorite dismutase [Acidimicrobiaceae bacterium]